MKNGMYSALSAVAWLIGIAMIYQETNNWMLVGGIVVVVGANNIMRSEQTKGDKL